MKDRAIEIVAAAPSPGRRLALLREYLQAEILLALQDRRAFDRIAFVGGTALRFLHGLGRYSENLDFSAIEETQDLTPLWQSVAEDLRDAGYAVLARLSKRRGTVSGIFYRFEGILKETGLSPLASQRLAIRAEADLRPPAGAVLETTLLRRHFLLALRHHDLPSLFAGKCHAVLQRAYTKGRDFYDLAWYLTRGHLRPNLTLLGNALRQTGWMGPPVSEENWRAVLARAVSTRDWRRVEEELSTFLEDPREAASLRKETLLALLAGQ